MSRGTLLLIGPGLPYHVLDYAITWAKENEGSLRTLFVVRDDLQESFPFPHILDDTESLTGDTDAEGGVDMIIRNESRFIERRCNASHVPVDVEILSSPTAQKVLVKLRDSEIVFVDKNAEAFEDEVEHLPFTLTEISKQASGHFVVVGEADEYSDVTS